VGLLGERKQIATVDASGDQRGGEELIRIGEKSLGTQRHELALRARSQGDEGIQVLQQTPLEGQAPSPGIPEQRYAILP